MLLPYTGFAIPLILLIQSLPSLLPQRAYSVGGNNIPLLVILVFVIVVILHLITQLLLRQLASLLESVFHIVVLRAPLFKAPPLLLPCFA